jgi:hypothetical protein
MKKLIFEMAKVITAVATIGGAALWLDAKFDNSTDTLDEINQKVDYINVEQQFMAEDIQGIHDTLDRIENMQVKQGERQKSIVWILRNQDNFSAEQLEDIMSEMLKKNGTHATPLEP